jgi:DNA-binding Xre family transcriptional regulator
MVCFTIWSMKVVNSHLKILAAEKSLREKRPIGIMTLVREADVSRSTAQRLLNNTIKQVPLDDLGKLCTYFDCEVGDILRFEEVPPSH